MASILIDVAAHPFCAKAIAFEPNPDAVVVIDKSLKLNSLVNITVISKALGHVKMTQRMSFGSHSPTASLLSTESLAGSGVDVDVSTLDSEIDALTFTESNVILLVDVEGYELNVLSGGKGLIQKYSPLIVFEYHQETKKVFGLDELRNLLGDEYQIYRVRQDAMLDGDVENAWNCVAIPRNTQFAAVLQSRIIA